MRPRSFRFPIAARDRSLWLLVTLLILSAGALRVACAQDDLWFDEVWSWWIARGLLPTWLIDNNHPLNTLWISLVPDAAPTWVFRLLSIVSGAATILFGALVARRWGRLHALATAFVLAAAYPLVLYQSEARGYAPMLAAMLATLWLSLRHVDRPTRRGPIWVLLAVLVGICSHLGFIVGYVGIVAITATFPLRCMSRERARVGAPIVRQSTDGIEEALTPTLSREYTGEGAGRVSTFMCLHAVPLVICAIAYFGFYSRMEIGGGPIVPVVDALRATAGEFIGFTEPYGMAVVGVMLLIGVFAWRRGKFDVVMLLAMAITSALAIAWKQRGDVLYVRYFLPSMLMAWLACGWALGEIARRRPKVAGALLAAWMALQVSPVMDLLTVGRAHHGAALAWMTANSASGEVRVGTDQPTRTGVLVEFYRRRLAGDHRVEMLPEGAPLAPADWLILGPRRNYPDVYRADDGTPFVRSAVFPTCNDGPHGSGWAWQVYRRVDAPTMVSTPKD